MSTTTTTTTAATNVSGTKKSPTGLKKVLKYFQDQATHNSSSKAVIYLSPPGQEPQQKISHRRQTRYKPEELLRTLSNATTAVEPRRQQQHRNLAPFPQVTTGRAEMRSSNVLPQRIRKIQYASENLLQSYELFQPENLPDHVKEHGYWILFIHGGYFRDPKVDAASFRPALNLLTSTASATIAEESESSSTNSATPTDPPNFSLVRRHAAGYASINYRLSASDEYPQDPDTTLKYEERNARYPDQLNDIIAAIKHLNSRHNFGNRYILAGHSVGAALAYLTALRAAEKVIAPPTCVIGLNGIYDFPGIHRTNPDYEAMTKSAMTPEQYEEASPALYPPHDYVRNGNTARFLLTHSRDDELVDYTQTEVMALTLEKARSVAAEKEMSFSLEVLETKGRHDEIWSRGQELARSICEGVRIVTS